MTLTGFYDIIKPQQNSENLYKIKENIMLITRPPMGWNSWNTFAENITEDLIKETADALVDKGLADIGYKYVVIDDCWALMERDADGRLVPDPKKFPSGMKALADYIHSKGLKFGIYSCDGYKTCAGYPGSYGYEYIDAKTFADWGVDYLKYDNCNKPDVEGRLLYNRMSMALKASGRDIVFSACNWGTEDSDSWIRSVGAHLYRSTGDIFDNYNNYANLMIDQITRNHPSAPGCFNDLDMLITGIYGKGHVSMGVYSCTEEIYRMHFLTWCFYGSPLMIGCDIRNVDDASLALFKNEALVRLAQDAEARPPFLVQRGPYWYTMLRHLEDGEYAIAYINIDDNDMTLDCDFANFGLGEETGLAFDFVDLMSGEQMKNVSGGLSLRLDGRSCRILRGRVHAKA